MLRFNDLPADKRGHFWLGAIPGVLISVLFCWACALVVVAFIGVGKEISDLAQNIIARRKGEPEPHSVEVLDIVATLAGGCVGIICGLLILFATN
jgi:hypothetical protein